MGKSGKKPKESQRHGRGRRASQFGDDDLPSSAYDAPPPRHEDSDDDDSNEATAEDEQEGDAEAGDQGQWQVGSMPSKFHLYQLSVQSPKGDISYLQKFFLMYVGGRVPLHLQEDFCGTALLSTEWLRTDARRTAIGLDLDRESLEWCLENNLGKIGADGYSRMLLFHGNVLQPNESCLVKLKISDLTQSLRVTGDNGSTETNSCEQSAIPKCLANSTMSDAVLPGRDIICAFNYSCCCLHSRKDLVLYFRHAFSALSKRGGIFVMDVYGGTSSECKLRLQRRFPSFTYFWEQEDFDIITRQTRISLHFQVGKKQMLRHAFTYHWRLRNGLGLGILRFYLHTLMVDALCSAGNPNGNVMRLAVDALCSAGSPNVNVMRLAVVISVTGVRDAFSCVYFPWSIPEIKDCLEEAGFKSIHVWIREMPNTQSSGNAKEYTADRDVKYEELQHFNQGDAWNAYVVGVANTSL